MQESKVGMRVSGAQGAGAAEGLTHGGHVVRAMYSCGRFHAVMQLPTYFPIPITPPLLLRAVPLGPYSLASSSDEKGTYDCSHTHVYLIPMLTSCYEQYLQGRTLSPAPQTKRAQTTVALPL